MRWSIENKMRAGFGLSLMIVGVVGVACYLTTSRLIHTAEWLKHSHETLDGVNHISATMDALDTLSRADGSSGDEILLQRHRHSLASVDRGLRDLRHLTADNARQQARLDVLDPLIRRRLATEEGSLLRMEHASENARSPVKASKPLPDKIRAVVAEMKDEETSLWTQREEEARSSARYTIWVFTMLFLLVSGLSLLIYSGVQRDLTSRRRAEEEREQLNQDLQRQTAQLQFSNKELEAFAYSISHDLRAPLRSIDGFSRILQEDCADKLDENGKDCLCHVRAASQRMGQLIDDLLNLSRLSRSELRLDAVDLSGLAKTVVAELRQRDPQRQVEVRIADDLMAQGDARLLRVVFDNLLGNAWKFTSKKPQATIEVGSSGNNGSKGFFVHDNGAGFDMAYSDKLFGAFQRLHAMEEFSGTGIGLATVARIINRHGGRVWAEGTVNQGATFHFALPSEGGASHV